MMFLRKDPQVLPSDFRWAGPWNEMASSESGRACLLRHLVVAAEGIARSQPVGSESDHFAAIAARLRDMDGSPDGLNHCPSTNDGTGSARTLLEFLAEAWLERRGRLPARGLDPELLDAADEMLRGLVWRVPSGPASSPLRGRSSDGYSGRNASA